MKKFILWISISIFIGVGAFFSLNLTGVQAVGVVHDKCPRGPFTIIPADTADLELIDRNGDDVVCLHDNGIAIVDNNAAYVKKKKKAKKKAKK